MQGNQPMARSIERLITLLTYTENCKRCVFHHNEGKTLPEARESESRLSNKNGGRGPNGRHGDHRIKLK
jgi:hypothetical protein